ncbi:PWWP domain-containing protein 1 [Elaeis guineensis]|uniref:Uncharacterized protein LOC105052490 n=1 Tax=Elaeis guineensis var. tenera TaxID=51953 RepID=A0A6I9RSZ6_ELAGV|nr:uncharacterized protein LOC105052490 [Elaeis guineensis]
MIFVDKEVDRNPATATADISFVGMEKPQDGTRVSDGSVRQSGGSGSNPSRVLPDIDPAAAAAQPDAEIELEVARVSESEDARNDSSSVNAGVDRSMPVQAENRVSNTGAATQEPVSLQLSLAPQAAPPESWMHGFEIGDMVWGKVKSHPWWPGYIYNVHFAPPDVRRTRKEGHLLVAFFGDSSYGWFVPDEVIPFESYYLEKSKQTTSKNFVLAMDEAVYEESRRAALGLTCCCRKVRNFRYFGFPGYVCVDVPGYERGAEYSVKQIDRSRESFVPEELLSFLLQLALASQSDEPWGIDFIRRKARLLAYRKAVYEEYDETYPQAFGVQPVRPSPNDAETLDRLDYFAPRAMLLSGQLRIAENLGDARLFSSSSRPATGTPKSPSSLKKTKYVLIKKRKEERGVKHPSSSLGFSRPIQFLCSPPPKTHEMTRAIHYHKSPQRQAAASKSQAGGNYMLQRPSKLMSEGRKVATSNKLQVPSEQKETKLAVGPSAMQQASATSSHMEGQPLPTDGHSSNNLRRETKSAVALPASDRAAREESSKARAVATLNGVVVKKKKAPKRLRDDAGSVGPEDSGGIKKKKTKKVLGIEAGPSRDGRESYGKFAGRSTSTGLGHGQIVRTESQKRDDGVLRTSDLHSAAARQPRVDVSSLSLEFPQLLSDLKELAADPLYAIERNAPGVVLQVFSKFRSQVYQKSLHPPESDHDMAKLQATRVAVVARSLVEPGAGNADMVFGKEAKDHREPSSSALKLLKPKLKPNDPRKAVRKRRSSDQQEQSNEKKLRKMNQLNAVAIQKKAEQRSQKESRTATASAASAKPNNKGADTVKKQEPAPPPLPFSPTALLLKFPLGTSLPSVAKLKARLAVFGPLVKDSTRVYWKSDSCKVVFKHKPHAEAALNYSRKNDLLLGPLRCCIRELDPTTLKPLSFNPGKLPPPQSHLSHGPLVSPGNGGQPRALPYQQQQAPIVQLKSILKKRCDVGGGSVGNAAREAPRRVTFILDGRDNDRIEKEPPVAPAVSNGNGGSYAAGSSSSLPLMDPMTNSKNPKSSGLLPTPPPPLHSHLSNSLPLRPSISFPPPPRAAGGPFPSIALPLPLPPPPRVVGGPPPRPLPHTVDTFEAGGFGPAQFNESRLQHNGQHAVVGGTNKPDISSQMLILLRKCSHIVNNIKSSLGYIPYRPL